MGRVFEMLQQPLFLHFLSGRTKNSTIHLHKGFERTGGILSGALPWYIQAVQHDLFPQKATFSLVSGSIQVFSGEFLRSCE